MTDDNKLVSSVIEEGIIDAVISVFNEKEDEKTQVYFVIIL